MRQIDTKTLDRAAQWYYGRFLLNEAPFTREWVVGQFFNFTFADEFDHVVGLAEKFLTGEAMDAWRKISADVFQPRNEKTLHKLLESKLAIDPDGEHKKGVIGSTVLHGHRPMGLQMIEVEAPWSIQRRKKLKLDKSHREVITRPAMTYWPIYAGEPQEREVDSGVADPLPPGTPPLPVGALNTRISNEVALLMCDAMVDNLDEGTSNAIVCGYSGSQPTDPDTAATGTKLFTLACSDPAFGSAADDNPGGKATAATITADSSADATATLGYCRGSSSNDGATALDDHIDGEAGTAGADYNFNTVAIVAGAQVSVSAWTITQPES